LGATGLVRVCSCSLSFDKDKGGRSMVILVCWIIWRERNARIFEAKERPVQSIIAEVKEEAHLWSTAGANGITSFVE
jgi:hypothetical protein